MVVITLSSVKNGQQVYFPQTIPAVSHVRLISAKIPNSWHNLTENGTLTRAIGGSDDEVINFPAGFTTLEEISRGFRTAFDSCEIDTVQSSASAPLTIIKPSSESLSLNQTLADFLNVDQLSLNDETMSFFLPPLLLYSLQPCRQKKKPSCSW